MLTIYAEAELNCDGKPCVNIVSPTEIHHTAYTIGRVRTEIKREAKKEGWVMLEGEWLCPACVKAGKGG